MMSKELSQKEKKKLVATRVATLLYTRGFSQTQLGKMLEVSHTTIQNYLNEQTLPDENKLRRLARIYGLSYEDFMNTEVK